MSKRKQRKTAIENAEMLIQITVNILERNWGKLIRKKTRVENFLKLLEDGVNDEIKDS